MSGVQTDYLLRRSDELYLKVEGLNPDRSAHVQDPITYLQKLNGAMEALLKNEAFLRI